MKKLFLIVLAVLLLVTGCTNDKTVDTNEGNLSHLLNEPGTLPIVKEPVTLTVGLPTPLMVEDMNTNYHTKWMEEKTGVKLEFVLFPANEAASKLEILVSSDSELPDMLWGFGLDDLTVYKYGSRGTFIDLTPYYEKQSKYIKEAFEKTTLYDMKKILTSPDGKMYSVGRVQEETHTEYFWKYYMNKTWLDKLGLEEPQTLEELYDVLVAFRDSDLNGNGKKDEIPMVGATGANQNPIIYIMNSFIYADGGRDYLLVDDKGKIDVAYNKPEWREGLRYINKLVEEGLLSPLSFSQDSNQLKQMITNPENMMVGSFTCAGYNTLVGNRMNDYVGLGPVTGPEGIGYTPFSPSFPRNNGHITKDCKNPEIAFQYMDYMWSYEASTGSRYGELGVDWRLPEEGEKGYLEYLGYAPKRAMLLDSAAVQNKWWNCQTPMYLNYEIVNGQVDTGDENDAWRVVYEGLGKMVGKIPDNIVAKIIYTEEQIDKIGDIKTVIKTYVEECMTRFAVGDLDIEKDWDNYIKELEKMQLDEYIKVTQEAYDAIKIEINK